jgi:hypothetical protein
MTPAPSEHDSKSGSETSRPSSKRARPGSRFAGLRKLTRAIAKSPGRSLLLALIVVTLIGRVRYFFGTGYFELDVGTVPEAFAKAGWASDVILRRLEGHLAEIDRGAPSKAPAQVRWATPPTGEGQAATVAIAGQSVPIRLAFEVLRWIVGARVQRINVDITRDADSTAVLSVQVMKHMESVRVRTPPYLDDAALRGAAESIVQHIDPYRFAVYLLYVDEARAAELLRDLAASADRHTRARALVGLGLLARRRANDVAAADFYRASRRSDSSLPVAVLDLAILYEVAGWPGTAVALLDSCPGRGGPWAVDHAIHRSAVLQQSYRFAEAEQEAGRAIRLRDGFSPRVNLARARLFQQHFGQARDAFEDAGTYMSDASGGSPKTAFWLDWGTLCALTDDAACVERLADSVSAMGQGAAPALAGRLLRSMGSLISRGALPPSVLGSGGLRTGADSLNAGQLLAYVATDLVLLQRDTVAGRLVDVALAVAPTATEVRVAAVRLACRQGHTEAVRGHLRALQASGALLPPAVNADSACREFGGARGSTAAGV